MRGVLSLIVIGGLVISCSLPNDSSFDFRAQYIKDTTSISAYVKSNAIHSTKLSYGVWFIDDVPGTGIRATYDDSVYLTYKMRLLSDNSIVDQSSSPVLFVLSNLIPGIQVAMPYFQVGSQGRIFIPSYYGYQNSPKGAVPANSNLIFEFTLNDAKDYQLKKDTVTVNKYLKDHQINAMTDVSGLRYTIDVPYSGNYPSLSDSVQMKLTSRYLSGDTIQHYTTPFNVLVSDLPIGVSIGLLNLQQGVTATMYVPSSLAYGNRPNNFQIKPGSNLIYHIEFIQITHH